MPDNASVHRWEYWPLRSAWVCSHCECVIRDGNLPIGVEQVPWRWLMHALDGLAADLQTRPDSTAVVLPPHAEHTPQEIYLVDDIDPCNDMGRR